MATTTQLQAVVGDVDVISASELRDLVQARVGLSVSIYMPTHRMGKETQQNPVRLTNLLDQAQEKLIAAGMRRPEARDMIGQARALLDDAEFWRHQSDGLAVLIDSGAMRRYRVPIVFQELTVVGERFHIKPLFPMVVTNGLFYVLAASGREVRLLRCTRDRYQELKAPEFAEGEEAILKYIEEQKALQWHTQTGYSPAGRAAVFHGQGSPATHHKDRIFEYFRIVATTARRLIGGDLHSPVVFAGVEYLFPIFQEANNNDLNLLTDHLGGNPDEVRVSSEQLHRAGLQVVQPYLAEMRHKAFEWYRTAAGTRLDRVANTIEDAVHAAHDGRIGHLFARRGAMCWGRFEPATGRVEVHDLEMRGDEDLIDFTIAHTFLHRGNVYVVESDDMPDKGVVAALLRY